MSYASLGQLSVETPSGHTAFISEEEEIAIAKRALEEQMIHEIQAEARKTETLTTAGIQAVGTAVGLALGGLLVYAILGKIK